MKTIHGALVEYGNDFLGPIPNVVIFQFNPESMSRTLTIPPRPVNATQRETSQAGEPAYERFTVNVTFSAADAINDSSATAIASGIGPQLAALEAMVYPVKTEGGIIGAGVDAISSLLSSSRSNAATQPTPRQQNPRLLFIWGATRILPVIIESLTITEQQYDGLLNPVEAQVAIGLAVITPCDCCDDKIGKGALAYTQMAKDTLATINLVNSVLMVPDLIPF